MQASFLTIKGARLRRTLRDRQSLGLALFLALLLAALPAAAFAEDGAAGGSSVQPATGASMPANGLPDAAYAAPSLETLPASRGELLDAGQDPTVVVHIRNLSFGDPLSVAPGTTVQWINDDSVTHTVTADDGTFDSGDLAPGASFKITFTQPGFYPYYCQLHGGPGGQGMSSMITVSDQAGTAGGQANPPAGGKNSVPNLGSGMTSGSGQNAAPNYGSAVTPKSGATGSQAYPAKKAPAYGGAAASRPGYTSQRKPSYGSYVTRRYVVPLCRVPYRTSRYSRYSAYGYARPYGATHAPSYRMPWGRRGY